MMAKLSDFLRIGDAAEYLGISVDTLRRWDRAGKLTARRHPVSRYRLYVRTELDALLGRVDEIEAAEPPPRRVRKKAKAKKKVKKKR